MTVIYVNNKQGLPVRSDFDYYPTPAGYCYSALQELTPLVTPKSILDPGAGTGSWGSMCRKVWPQSCVTGVDLRPVQRPAAYNFWYTADYMRMSIKQPCFDLIVGNPPFKYAEEFIRCSLPMIESGGYLMFLLRVAFLEGQSRAAGLWKDYPPYKVIISSRRINFTGNSNPNSYALFVWQKGYTGSPALGWMTHEDNTAVDDKPVSQPYTPMFAELLA